MTQELLDYLRRGYLFNELTEEDLEPLLRVAKLRHFRGGDYLFCYEDEAEFSYLVVSGAVTVYRWTPEGERKVFHTLEPGQMVAEAAMFMRHGRYPMNARADENTSVYAVPRTALQQICLAQPEVALKLLESMGQRLFSLVNRVDQLSSTSAGRCFASWIADRCRDKDTPVMLEISRQHLAVQLGIAPETLSRLLKKYRAAGFLSGQRGQFVVQDLRGLLTFEQIPAQ